MQQDLKSKAFNGVLWKGFERIGLNLLNLVLPIYLARILLPKDFGVISIMLVFIDISNTLVNNGLCTAIIQKKDSDEIDKSTVFWIQVFIAVFLYLVLFFSSPLIADIYNSPEIKSMLRVMSLSIIIGSFAAMQTTELNRTLQFKKSFIANLLATIVYGSVGIALGKLGFGAWSLVYANVLNKLTLCLTLSIAIRWKPLFKMSYQKFKNLFSYSWKLTVGWLIGTLHQNIYTMVIGKVFDKTTLGYYSKSQVFPNLFSRTSTEVLTSAIFSTISKVQDSMDEVKKVTRKLMAVSSFIILPIMAGLSATADKMVPVILTAKWLPIVPLLRIFCIPFAINVINNANMQPYNAIGRSDIFMKFEIIKRSFSVVLLIIVSFFNNIRLVACVVAFMGFVSLIMNLIANKRVLKYKISEQVVDILPNLIISVVMALCVYSIGVFSLLSNFVTLIIQVLVGGLVYILISAMFKTVGFTFLFSFVKQKLKKSNFYKS